jgi:hypothetical protein
MVGDHQGVPELNYTSNNNTAHRLNVFDVDKRDMLMAIYVDDILRGLTRDFDLDLEEDCGLDVYLCSQKNFSAGSLVIPAGKHQVSIQWKGKGKELGFFFVCAGLTKFWFCACRIREWYP